MPATIEIPVVTRWRWRLVGAHVHVRVFCGRAFTDDTALGKAGDLIFREDEWPTVAEQMRTAGVHVLVEGA